MAEGYSRTFCDAFGSDIDKARNIKCATAELISCTRRVMPRAEHFGHVQTPLLALPRPEASATVGGYCQLSRGLLHLDASSSGSLQAIDGPLAFRDFGYVLEDTGDAERPYKVIHRPPCDAAIGLQQHFSPTCCQLTDPQPLLSYIRATAPNRT
jgi:hypothetical protein